MTTPLVSFNPMAITNGAGLFVAQTGGYVQGSQEPDPAARYALANGILAASETLLMFPGTAISAFIPGGATNPPDSALGPQIGRALSAATIAGFSIMNQAYNMLTTPTSTAPVSASGMSVQWVGLGSNARIVVQISPALAATLTSGTAAINTQVSWDYNGQMLVPYEAAYAANVFTAMSWSAGVVTGTTTTAHGLSVGDQISVSGVAPAGYNGTYTLITVTTGSTIKYALATNPGTVTTQGQIDAGGGALPCKILNINIGNSLVIDVDANGVPQWVAGGNAALIQI
jgi:hypothetical protein